MSVSNPEKSLSGSNRSHRSADPTLHARSGRLRRWPMKRFSLLGLVCVNGVCSTYTYASDSADVLKGMQLARIACSDCHVVASDLDSPPLQYAAAPRFDDIASRPGTSEKSLQKFITTTHWDGETLPITMPKPDLIKSQVVALSRYIMSLRKR